MTNASDQQVYFHTYFPFGEEATAFDQTKERLKFTGHERDLNATGGAGDDLDYMHARYCSPVTGRFLAVDPARESAKPARPQSWNRYSYSLNNPVKYVDPDGQVVETAWDVLSIGIGFVSLYQNVRDGNIKEALVDAGGIAVDALAAAIPVVPGGAGAAIKTARLAENAGDAVSPTRKVVDKVVDASTPTEQKGDPLNVALPDGRKAVNSPATVDGREFSGHALDKLQSQGIPPSVAAGAIRPGNAIPGKTSGTTAYFDSANNITVITDAASGRVVTVTLGRIKQ